MKLSEHFTFAEFTASDTAARRGIDNTLPDSMLPAAQATAQMLERIRAALGNKPIIITSGYRCVELNAAIGSARSSDHVKAMAIDFKCPGFGLPYDVARYLSGRIEILGIGQIILEFATGASGWVHVSTRIPEKIINRVITISSVGTQAGVQRA